MTTNSAEQIYNVTESGVMIPKQFLEGVEKVVIRKEKNAIIVTPLPQEDSIAQLGKNPIALSMSNASENHDIYLYGRSE